MIVLYVILALVCLVLLPLFLNFHLILEYDGEARAFLRVLFIKLDLIKLSEKLANRAKKPKKQKKKRKKKSEPQPAEKRPDRKKKPSDILDFLKFAKKIAADAASRLLKRLRIRLAYLNITVATEQADKTALLYGAVCTAVSSLDEVLRQFARYSADRDKINVGVDYLAEKTVAKAKLIFTIKPIFVIGAAFGVIVNLFNNKNKISNGKELKNERNTAQTNH